MVVPEKQQVNKVSQMTTLVYRLESFQAAAQGGELGQSLADSLS